MIDPAPPQVSAHAYWLRHDVLGEVLIEGQPWSLYLRQHVTKALYSAPEELTLPIQAYGRRIGVHAQAYVEAFDFIPAITEPERPHCIGHAQAWYYPDERLLQLSTCSLFDAYRAPDPGSDALLASFWDGFERLLTQRFQGAARLVTPGSQEARGSDEWAAFLEGRGFRPLNEQVWQKPLPPRRRKGKR